MQGHAFDISYRNTVLVQDNSNSTWNKIFEFSATKNESVFLFVCLFLNLGLVKWLSQGCTASQRAMCTSISCRVFWLLFGISGWWSPTPL